ncbi:uncharacterized protein HMPREF1541_05391 [Cyphellophora europaea CBS 101466]|uniref:RED-like N-terminal domain-containing protein n=1 Tax=Cyphellophora europaea (strain CBS 101466) TaxID=1220924 RepID=W2RTT2_CYPE1|nr:uncharacterized protein HMPREF1541_05391 [Cyphellophora europaea CBS 101466]ETN39168.1 hypothetical protein HMPREF1541_05391 [Cyphellophora europaea CBS 101466]
MNNSEFRNLLQKDAKSANGSAINGASLQKPSLGSRARAAIPMTPRSVMGRNASTDFARQVAEHTRSDSGEPPAKKFKSRSAPRGTRLAQGYSDRTTARRDDEEEESDKVKKLKELEQMVKEEKIDRATFEKLRDSMGIGGDLGTTHLVKGLDFKLLEKTRRGDDLNETPKQAVDEASSVPAEEALDEELDHVLDHDIVARTRDSADAAEDGLETTEAQPMTRDEILRKLKEARNADVAPAPLPALGDRFKKVARIEKAGKKKFVESINGRRREVLVITKEDGSTKRKTRWLDPEPVEEKPQVPLGMEVPAEFAAKQKALAEQEAAEDEDDDIFQGVGADYDPLKDIDSDADDNGTTTKPDPSDVGETKGRPRNYFNTSGSEDQDRKQNPIMQDPTLLAALKRAAAIRQDENSTATDATSHPDQSEKSKRFLQKLKERERQDARDLDLGFGDSRFGDDDDEDGPIYEDGDEHEGKKRKRGPKKRKGDKDNVADVMSVLSHRKP